MKKYKLIKPIFHEFFRPTDPGKILYETDKENIYEYISQYGNSKTPDSKIKLTPEELADKTVEILDEPANEKCRIVNGKTEPCDDLKNELREDLEECLENHLAGNFCKWCGVEFEDE